MKVLITLALLVACASAYYYPYAYNAYPYAYHAYPYAYNAYPYAQGSQYHAQSALGYNYGYSDLHSNKFETKDAFGVTHGGYSYIDANGKVQTVRYTADAVNGFRVEGSNLPVAPKADLKQPVAPVANLVMPEPVQDTAEVREAKAEFHRMYNEAAAKAAEQPESREKRDLVAATPFHAYPYYHYPAFAYNPVEVKDAEKVETKLVASPYAAFPYAHFPYFYYKSDKSDDKKVEAEAVPFPYHGFRYYF